MKYIIFLLIYIILIIFHGFYFQDSGERFLDAVRERQYLWLVYFFAAHVVTEFITKRILR